MSDTLPLVSIITPAYNRASYLDETIQSILKQDYPRIEYIVLDDGSTDNTREVLEKYTGRIIWETHPNMGEARTVNKGWSMAHGEIVAVVNSDDPLLPGAVSAAVAFMQSRPDILVAYPAWDFIGADSKPAGHTRVPEYDYLKMLKYHDCMPGPGAFIRRRSFELTSMRDPDFRYVNDFEYWLRLGLYGEFARIPQTLATWRFHPDATSLTGRGTAMANEHVRLVEKLYSLPALPLKVSSARPQAFSSAHLHAATLCYGARWACISHSLSAILSHPVIPFCGWLNWRRWATVFIVMLPEPLGNLGRKLWYTNRSTSFKALAFLKRHFNVGKGG